MRLPVSRRQQALLASLGCTALLLLGIAHTQGRLPARPVSAGSRSWKQWAWRETAGGSNFTWHRPLFYEGREGLVDSLNPSNRYLLSWPFVGLTNQLMTVINAIYLAHLTGMIPIIPPLYPDSGHITDRWPTAVPDILLSEIFDVPALFAMLGMPYVHLDDIHPAPWPGAPYEREEVLPCWGMYATQFQDCAAAIGHPIPDERNLSLAMTPLPHELYKKNKWGEPAVFEYVANFLRDPEVASSWSDPPAPGVFALFDEFNAREPHMLRGWEPEVYPQPRTDPLTCIDGSFYMVSAEAPGRPWMGVQEQFRDGYPSWQVVGQHMKFLPVWEHAAREMERRLLGVPEGEAVPPFFGFHLRRGDSVPTECYTDPEKAASQARCRPLEMFGSKLDECVTAARKAGRIGYGGTERVLVMSDEDSPEFLAEVEAKGYILVDHTRHQTAASDGPLAAWSSGIIDAIIMSHAACFIGSARSTMSEMASRRGQDWYGNKVAFV